jgi:cyclopropane-fatty-acyl-phospholipid synthase
MPRDTRLVLELLQQLRGGLLEVHLPNGSTCMAGAGEDGVRLQVHDEAMFAQVLSRGDIGLAEAYLDGAWDSPDITALLALLAKNRDALRRAVYGSWHQLLAARIRHWLNRNSRSGSKRNIMAHYDLGNDFYAFWLDGTTTYSAGLFAGQTRTLEEAQLAKYRRIMHRLQSRPGDHILEIGCGWGGFAEVAATEFGCRVTGLTLSPAQLAYATERARRGGYAAQVEFLLCDYREIAGQFDAVVSIEMFEAVGERYWPAYFRQVRRSLKPEGRAVIQAITIAHPLFGRYRRGTDFIQRYIFPGGMLASPEVFTAQAAGQGLRLIGDLAFGADYARTLRLWHERFVSCREALLSLGFDERFIRMWRFYLAYCEAGFAGGTTDVHQFELVRDSAA